MRNGVLVQTMIPSKGLSVGRKVYTDLSNNFVKGVSNGKIYWPCKDYDAMHLGFTINQRGATVMAISNNRGAHRVVEDSNGCLKTT